MEFLWGIGNMFGTLAGGVLIDVSYFFDFKGKIHSFIHVAGRNVVVRLGL